MNIDKYGLPVQSDGDANDQLQRVSMIDAIENIDVTQVSKIPTTWALDAPVGVSLEILPGVYSRYIGGNTNNVSCDQLVAALAAHVVHGRQRKIGRMFLAMCKRFGFAQNYKDGLNDEAETKLPDFMLIRALPLFTRASVLLYPVCLITDALLVLSALSACGPVWRDGTGFARRAPGDVDDNNTVLTLAACRFKMPTPLSILSCFILAKLRPWNLGCVETTGVLTNNAAYKPVFGALRHYHRAESGGNPEVAEMWRKTCDKWFS